jgi:two-component system phosphate regulon sensor histidine kinase PhoR
MCIAGLHREGSRLQDLIDRLLDWGRMESGRRQFHMEPTDVRTVVQRAIGNFEGVRERQNARLTVSLPEQLPPLWAESASISDALLNLLTNASKYGGHPAEITLRVTAQRDCVRIAVQDNGIGIPQREHKRIFQKFYRIDDRLSRDMQGSGLGLAIARHVVKAHGGRIEVESALGKGSVFTIVLPVLRAEQVPVTLARASRV